MASLDPVLPQRRPGLIPLLGRVLAAVLIAAAGFLAGMQGSLPFPTALQQAPAPLEGIAYVPLKPIVIALNVGGVRKHLKFLGQLEVVAAYQPEVSALLPRIMDVLNSYLHAVDLSMVEGPGTLTKLRAQMLRRLQIVTGEGRVNDLLVMELLVN